MQSNCLGENRRRELLEFVFAFEDQEKDAADIRISQEGLWESLANALKELKAVDPACGSGSFLVGMLTTLDDLWERIQQHVGARETVYMRRKRIIGENLYGAEVKKWAVEVAELRLWLQLIVDTDIPAHERTIVPLLPNLGFNIRCGDSVNQRIGGLDLANLDQALHVADGKPNNRLINLKRDIKHHLNGLRGDKLQYYHNDPERRCKSDIAMKEEERRVFLHVLNATRRYWQDELAFVQGEAAERQQELFSQPGDESTAKDVRGNEIESQIAGLDAAIQAIEREKRLPFLWNVAFVEVFSDDKCGFDIVIGNPPYIRQEEIQPPLMEDAPAGIRKQYKNELMEAVCRRYPRYFRGRKLDGRNDLYVNFYFIGLHLLNPAGVFCFITSNSWLDVGYGRDLQEFLLRRCRIHCIVDNQVERSFKNASINTAIALLGAPATRDDGNHAARFVMVKTRFEEVCNAVIWEELLEASDKLTTEEYRLVVKQQREILAEGAMPQEKGKAPAYGGVKWGGLYLRAPEIYWKILEKGRGKFVRLGDVADVRFGIKTGANEFFYLDRKKAERWGIEEEFLRPVIKSPRECRSLLIDPSVLKNRIFMCHKKREELKGTKALTYIEWGEEQGFHKRPSCRNRPRWWDIGNRRIAPIIVPCGVSYFMRVFQNSDVYTDKRLYEVYCDNPNPLALFMNSTIFSLFCELSSRTNLGEGLLDLTVEEISNCWVIKDIALEVFDSLPSDLYNIKQSSSLDEINNPFRKAIDNIFLLSIGLGSRDQEKLYSAMHSLIRDRFSRAQSTSNTPNVT